MNSVASVPVRDAVVLAAGNGDRFQNASHHSKLLRQFSVVLSSFARSRRPPRRAFPSSMSSSGTSGCRRRDGDQRCTAWDERPRDAQPDWHLENGARYRRTQSLRHKCFAVLMGDHLFEAPALSRLLRTRVGARESVLAIDTRQVDRAIAEEATKVRLRGDRITAIGKSLTAYDALDTGLFVCAPALFDALTAARASGDTTLSGGIRQLAAQGLMRAVDVGAAAWCDIDTIEDLEAAEDLFASHSEPEVA